MVRLSIHLLYFENRSFWRNSMRVYLTDKEATNVIDYYLDWRLDNKDNKISKKDFALGFKGKHAKQLLDSLGIDFVENETKGFYVKDKNTWDKAKKAKNL
jgi:hypothetical protein